MSASSRTQLASDPYGETFSIAGRGGREIRFRRLASAFAAQDGFADLLLSHRDPILALAGPNLVATVAIARDGKGRLIVAEELPTGASLASCLDLATASDRRLGVDAALTLARALVSALAQLHGAGLVHGLVHPRSVYLDAGGAVRLGDVAVAHAVAVAMQDAPELRALAADDLVPGDGADPVDARLDVCRAGRMLAMLAGAAGGGDELARLAEVTTRATSADPRERHADGGELLVHLDEVFGEVADDEAARRELAGLVADVAAARAEEADALARAITDAGEIASQVAGIDTSDEDEPEPVDAPGPATGLLARLAALPRASLVLIGAELVAAILLIVGLSSGPDRPVAPALAPARLTVPGAAAPAVTAAPADAVPLPAPAVDNRCLLEVRSTPADATVTVDGLTAGTTPVSIVGLRCDRTVAVTVDKVGFESWRRQLQLVAGEPFHVRAALERPTVTVRVASIPSGSQVSINGKPVGKTPLAIELNAVAQAAIVLQMKGHRPFRTTLVPARQREITAQLVPLRRAGARGPAQAKSSVGRSRGATASRPTK
ncbi:MAG TPA: PEGA domain-containing protein [Kofleriaceae bacterium]|nr:PEGA domain-containing protein [Kofleriaceae bacterium]